MNPTITQFSCTTTNQIVDLTEAEQRLIARRRKEPTVDKAESLRRAKERLALADLKSGRVREIKCGADLLNDLALD